MSGAERIDLITFPGAPNLPIFAALEHGDFLQNGVDVRHRDDPQFQLPDGESRRRQIPDRRDGV